MSRTRKILALIVLAAAGLGGCYGTPYGYTATYGESYDYGPYGYYYGGWNGAHPWRAERQVRRAERHARHEEHLARRHF